MRTNKQCPQYDATTATRQKSTGASIPTTLPSPRAPQASSSSSTDFDDGDHSGNDSDGGKNDDPEEDDDDADAEDTSSPPAAFIVDQNMWSEFTVAPKPAANVSNRSGDRCW